MMLPTRRGLLAGALAASFSAAIPALAMPRPSLDIADLRQRLRTYMLMRGALDEKLVVSCMSCRYFGVVDGVMTPFYDLVAATFSRFKAATGGSYDAVSFEIEYFVDPATSDVLDQWRNPYSGEIVAAKHTDSVPVRYAIGRDTALVLPPTPLLPGSRIERQAPGFTVLGDDVWTEERSSPPFRSRVPSRCTSTKRSPITPRQAT